MLPAPRSYRSRCATQERVVHVRVYEGCGGRRLRRSSRLTSHGDPHRQRRPTASRNGGPAGAGARHRARRRVARAAPTSCWVTCRTRIPECWCRRTRSWARWHETGDVVDIDDDGFIHILGRVSALRARSLASDLCLKSRRLLWPRRRVSSMRLLRDRTNGAARRSCSFTTDPVLTRERLQQAAHVLGSSDCRLRKFSMCRRSRFWGRER